MLILLLFSDQLHLRSPSAVCHHVCVCVSMTDTYVPHCATLPSTKTFFQRTTIQWNRLGNNSVHADSVVSFRLLMAHTHTHTKLYPPPPVFCSKNGGNRYFPIIWDQSTFNGFIKKNTQWHSPLVTQLFQYSWGNLVGPLGL